MSLPTDLDLPLREDYKNSEDKEEYMKDLVYELQEMYENIVQSVNGFIRNSAEVDQAKWKPTLTDTGAGVFTYTHQVGWSIRQGIFTHVFFDVRWSSSTATGTLSLDLPYKVTLSEQKPFVGVVQPSLVTLGAGYTNVVIVARPDTYEGAFQVTGTGLGSINLTSPTTVGRLAGHLMYIGVDGE